MWSCRLSSVVTISCVCFISLYLALNSEHTLIFFFHYFSITVGRTLSHKHNRWMNKWMEKHLDMGLSRQNVRYIICDMAIRRRFFIPAFKSFLHTRHVYRLCTHKSAICCMYIQCWWNEIEENIQECMRKKEGKKSS